MSPHLNEDPTLTQQKPDHGLMFLALGAIAAFVIYAGVMLHKSSTQPKADAPTVQTPETSQPVIRRGQGGYNGGYRHYGPGSTP